MIKLDAKAAADRIRAAFEGLGALSPEVHHAHAFAKEVCGFLGIDPDAVNVSHVLSLLHKADIAPHIVDDYPKMATRPADQDDVNAGRARFPGEVLPVFDAAGNPVVYDTPEAEAGFGKAKDGRPVVHDMPEIAGAFHDTPEAEAEFGKAKDAVHDMPEILATGRSIDAAGNPAVHDTSEMEAGKSKDGDW